MNPIESVLLRIRREEADIEPTVVVQEGPVGMGALALQICEEGAPHLPLGCDADDRRVFGGLSGTERNAASQLTHAVIGYDAALRQGLFETQEIATNDKRAAFHDACYGD